MAIDADSLGYLLPSDTQMLSHNGKPITGGHIEVYEAGTDNKYITYQSFDGVENPFSVIIPSDGRVVVLTEMGKKYDYYVYDSYRNPVFSRQNVLPVGKYDKHLYGEGDIYVTNGETSNIIFADFSKYAEKKDIVDYYGGQNIKVENDGKISLTNKTSLYVEAPISYRKETGKVILTTQTIPVNKGGTGATTPSAAANNLGVYTKNETDSNGRTVHHYNDNWQVGNSTNFAVVDLPCTYTLGTNATYWLLYDVTSFCDGTIDHDDEVTNIEDYVIANGLFIGSKFEGVGQPFSLNISCKIGWNQDTKYLYSNSENIGPVIISRTENDEKRYYLALSYPFSIFTSGNAMFIGQLKFTCSNQSYSHKDGFLGIYAPYDKNNSEWTVETSWTEQW